MSMSTWFDAGKADVPSRAVDAPGPRPRDYQWRADMFRRELVHLADVNGKLRTAQGRTWAWAVDKRTADVNQWENKNTSRCPDCQAWANQNGLSV